MQKIYELASKYNLKIIEDAAESHGAEYNGKMTGTLADITAFSFFANKNLTTGEGGMVITNDEELYRNVNIIKISVFPLDSPRNYIHEDIGFNYRMSNLHAAIGLAQVEQAEHLKEIRIKNAGYYSKYLSGIEGIKFQKDYSKISGDSSKKLNVHWMNGILIDPEKYGNSRNALVEHLKMNGIDTRIFFIGMHKQPSLIHYGCNVNSSYPMTENLGSNGLYFQVRINLMKKILSISAKK